MHLSVLCKPYGPFLNHQVLQPTLLVTVSLHILVVILKSKAKVRSYYDIFENVGAINWDANSDDAAGMKSN